MSAVKQTAGMDVCNLDASAERNTGWRERRREREREREKERERAGGRQLLVVNREGNALFNMHRGESPHTHTHTHTHRHTNAHTQTYTHVHTHTHTQT